MRKTLLALLLLAFGFSLQVRAASTNSNQGTKSGQTVPQAQGNQGVGNTVQPQEQNAVKTQNSGNGKTSNGNAGSNSASGSSTSTQKRSQVANAVQAMLEVADRNGGIGQQVKTIAQNQNQNQAKLEQNVANIQSRGGLAKFFVGSNYGEIKDAQKTLEQNKEQIRQLNQIRTQLSNEGDQQQLAEQIKVLEQADLEIENSLAGAQGGFSLFGWLNKLIS
jgi:hypothetical protein